ncbi:hypothetical protein F4778DRAFT_547822 [Xylariomycetidae sp. FL2044]|nr:hypothetical protein F4778DRAFT_547822 [Xylariomycetidae sp. FL2044]
MSSAHILILRCWFPRILHHEATVSLVYRVSVTKTKMDTIATVARIEVAPMSQLAELRDPKDDWTGMTDAAARRKAQTRLATRAYRKRKALEKKQQAFAKPRGSEAVADPMVTCWDEGRQMVSTIPYSELRRIFRPDAALLPDASTHASGSPPVVFPLCPDHLITLIQYNVLRALIVNRSLIECTTRHVASCIEPTMVVSYPARPGTVPASLEPTPLQQLTEHEDWIDIFPEASMRDHLIRTAGTYDEDALWSDTIGGMFDGFPADKLHECGLIIWDPPWDIAGWEMSPGFIKKWGWLLRDCPEALEATNKWRSKREEPPLVWEI